MSNRRVMLQIVILGIALILLNSLVLSGSRRAAASSLDVKIFTIGAHGPENITYQYMKEVTRLQRDGRAEMEVNWTVGNNGFFPVTGAGVLIRTPTAAYSNVRVWDTLGSLDHTLVVAEGEIQINIQFRYPVLYGTSYTYWLAIDLDDVAYYDGAAWNFDWTTTFPVAHFVRGVEFPAGASVGNLSPAAEVVDGEYYEWTRYNITEFHVVADYVLRDLSDEELLQRYAPYFRLHGEEVFTPMNVHLALQHAVEIWDAETDDRETVVNSGLLESAPWHDASSAYIDFHGDPGILASDGSEQYYIQNVKSAADAAPRVYARIYRDEPDNPTRIVLQYWIYYYFNPWFGGWLNHEGDWEMVLVALDASESPLYAAYAQHAPRTIVFYDFHGGSKKEWNDLERINTHPIVYVGLGSHASYFGPHSYLGGADRTGSETAPLIMPAAEMLPEDWSPRWVNFAGQWGESGFPNSGPRSPARQGVKWDNPVDWAESPDGIPWDEASAHHTGNLRAHISAPCNVGVTYASGLQYGWFYNGFVSEISGGEHVVNESTWTRWLIMHDSISDAVSDEFEMVATCEQVPTPSAAYVPEGEPVSLWVQFLDEAQENIVTLTYALPENWNVETSIARLAPGDEGDFNLRSDLDGDGVVDVVSPPLDQETEPWVEPQPAVQGNYLPLVSWQ